MSVARKVRVFSLRGPFGKRIVGLAGGNAVVRSTAEFLHALGRVDREEGTLTQVFDASKIGGVGHLVHAAHLALVASSTGHNFADHLGIELVCWVAAERQIARAFQKVGIHEGKMNLAFVVVGNTARQVRSAFDRIFRGLNVRPDDTVLELTRDKVSVLKEVFSISREELKIAPVERLIMERIALLSLAR